MKKILSIFGVMILVGTLTACGSSKDKTETEKEEEVKTSTENYVAYVKINPSVKISYSVECTTKGDNKECKDPIVSLVEPVNEDAKIILNGINLLDGDKDLKTVLNKLYAKVEEKGIKINKVEIQSDWSDMNTYLAKEETTTSNSNSNTQLKYTATVNNTKKEEIESTITSDVQLEEKQKEEAIKAKAAAEAKKKAEAEAKKKAAEAAKKKAAEAAKKKAAEAKAKAEAEKKAATIKLSDNVTYSHNMFTYECNKCFSTALINELKSAKGYHVTEANSSRITVKFITSLSGKYNTTACKGENKIGKITKAGGKQVGGAGGSGDSVTKTVCSEFHLICQ